MDRTRVDVQRRASLCIVTKARINATPSADAACLRFVSRLGSAREPWHFSLLSQRASAPSLHPHYCSCIYCIPLQDFWKYVTLPIYDRQALLASPWSSYGRRHISPAKSLSSSRSLSRFTMFSRCHSLEPHSTPSILDRMDKPFFLCN